jgi:hypothetical protein
VIPGIFIALLYRFDHYVGTGKGGGGKGTAAGGEAKRRYYFFVTIFAYALGLLITMGVMHYFKVKKLHYN